MTGKLTLKGKNGIACPSYINYHICTYFLGMYFLWTDDFRILMASFIIISCFSSSLSIVKQSQFRRSLFFKNMDNSSKLQPSNIYIYFFI